MKTQINKTLFIIVIALQSYFPQAFISENKGTVTIGNENLERVISTVPENFGTIEIKNIISKQSYKIHSDEFMLDIVFAGFGPGLGQKQNGENPSHITPKDLTYNGYTKSSLDAKTAQLTFNFSYGGYLTSLEIQLIYNVVSGENLISKYLEIKDNSAEINFLDRVSLESMSFDKINLSRGSFGQPVLGDDFFLGIEYPGVENSIGKNKVDLHYVVGKKIEKEPLKTFSSVLGVSSSPGTLEKTFYDYVDKIKIRGTRPFLLYNSWYDFRNPAIAESKESIMNTQNVLDRIETFKEFMVKRHGLNLDAFVLDDGWDNYKSIWEIDTNHLPQRFTPFLNPLKEMKTSLGIWASPFCGYSNRDTRVNWGQQNGYEKVGDFLCFSGTKYKKQFEKKMVEYVSNYNLGYFKWDGFLLACNEPNHGHLPGVYSRTDLIETYMHMMKSVAKVNPNIFINVTVGSWLSPWWLQYADCIWMQGEDYAYAEDVPSMNPRDKSITYRDAVLWQNFQRDSLLFPMSSLMTHGIIKGRLNFLGGKNEALSSFTNEVMMYVGRGVTMWELYVSPDLLTENEWNAIAQSIKWAKANFPVITKTKMILGNPLKREAYGYVHSTKEKIILLLRNPFVESKEIEIKLDESLGEIDKKAELATYTIYPYLSYDADKLNFGEKLKLTLQPYEIKVIELVPIHNKIKGVELGNRYSISGDSLVIYNDTKEQKVVIKNEVKPNQQEKLLTGEFFFELGKENLQSTIAFLFEPEVKLKQEVKPNFKMIINGADITPTVEQENGKWFWVYTALPGNQNKISYQIESTKNVKGKLEFYLFRDVKLQIKDIKKLSKNNDDQLPPRPFSEGIKKVVNKILSYNIK